VLAKLEAAEALAAESRARPRGELRVNAPVTFGAHSLAPLLPDYLAANPDVTVKLTLNDRVVDRPCLPAVDCEIAGSVYATSAEARVRLKRGGLRGEKRTRAQESFYLFDISVIARQYASV
jgi:DNA-binding transcriptional LysR family regulator